VKNTIFNASLLPLLMLFYKDKTIAYVDKGELARLLQ